METYKTQREKDRYIKDTERKTETYEADKNIGCHMRLRKIKRDI